MDVRPPPVVIRRCTFTFVSKFSHFSMRNMSFCSMQSSHGMELSVNLKFTALGFQERFLGGGRANTLGGSSRTQNRVSRAPLLT